MSSSGQVASCRIYARITEAPDVSLLIRAVAPLVRRRRLLHAGDVGGEEVDAVPVEVASGAVVVLGGSRVGMAGEDLDVAQRHTRVERVRDRGVPQRVRADVPRDASGFRDPGDHAVDVPSVDRLAGDRSQHQRPAGPLAAAGLQDAEHWTVTGMVAGLLPLPTRCRTRYPRRVSA